MLCLDIDGTLLNSKHEITQATKIAIKEAVDVAGIIVVLISARPADGMFFLQDELGLESPLVCLNGALIYDEHRQVIAEAFIPADETSRIHQLLNDMDLSFNLYRGDHWYVERTNDWADQEASITRTTPELASFETLLAGWTVQQTGPNKILIMGEPGKINQVDRLVNEQCQWPIQAFRSKDAYYEIIPQHVSKTGAIITLQNRYGIDPSEVIAVGDNYNDIDMLVHAGLGIAMGNAPEEVKSKAKAVTASNDEDGVARVIRRYILG
jgi:Cof subfamily protein (haloacid dehalogenase superfamily)